MPEETCEQGRLLSRKVVALQACVKGYLVRMKFRSLKREYENIVREVEGDSAWLQWNQQPLSKPVFLPKFAQKPIKANELTDQELEANRNVLDEKEETPCQAERLCVIENGSKVSLPNRLSAAVEPEAAGGKLNWEHLADKPHGSDFRLTGNSEEDKDPSIVSSVWNSTILEVQSPRQNQEPHSQRAQEVPRTVPELQQYRKHLAMELLWLQQAIVSRKNYLILKERLGSSE